MCVDREVLPLGMQMRIGLCVLVLSMNDFVLVM